MSSQADSCSMEKKFCSFDMNTCKSFILAGACTLALAVIPSCDSARPIETETIQFSDSTAHAYVTVMSELPAAVSGKDGEIRETLIGVMDRQMSAIAPGEDGRLFPAYPGDRTKTDELFTYYRQQVMHVVDSLSRRDAEDRLQYIENPTEYDFPAWGYEFNLEKTADTDRYVVFCSHNYLYMGGAHGGITGEGDLTFSKKTGQLIDSFLKPDCVTDLQPLLKKGLISYYSEFGGDPMTEKTLMEQLQIEGEEIPLPAWAPFPSEDGLTFTYQQYEIACYADGMPSFTIPYEEIKPFLSKEAEKLLF